MLHCKAVKLEIALSLGILNNNDGELARALISVKNNWDSATVREKELYKEIQDLYKELESMFEIYCVENRSYGAAKNIIEEMRKNNRSRAILVYGGAHARQITDFFDSTGVSYVVIEPKDYFETQSYIAK
jgi:hypothetical protein